MNHLYFVKCGFNNDPCWKVSICMAPGSKKSFSTLYPCFFMFLLDCSFYIILNGVVSVYIDGSKSGEEEKPKTPSADNENQEVVAEIPGDEEEHETSPPEENLDPLPVVESRTMLKSAQPGIKRALDRSAFGKCVIRFGEWVNSKIPGHMDIHRHMHEYTVVV